MPEAPLEVADSEALLEDEAHQEAEVLSGVLLEVVLEVRLEEEAVEGLSEVASLADEVAHEAAREEAGAGTRQWPHGQVSLLKHCSGVQEDTHQKNVVKAGGGRVYGITNTLLGRKSFPSPHTVVLRRLVQDTSVDFIAAIRFLGCVPGT